MRVLWFACSSACYEKAKQGSWVEALEFVVKKNLKDVDLGIAFEHPYDKSKVERDGVVYYPIKLNLSFWDKIESKWNFSKRDERLLHEYKKVIDDFNPDIIQCFGTEWPYGLISKFVKKPVIIHLMGCRNYISYSKRQILHKYDYVMENLLRPWSIIKYYYDKRCELYENWREREIFAHNRYFMGRTLWDKNIVKYFSPGSNYFHCEEAIREELLNSPYQWKYSDSPKKRFLTIANPSILKGNTHILQTASILKYEFGLDFEWRVTCNENDYRQFEKITGINHRDVNIKMIGRINANEIAKELSETQICIHISIIDNSPNSLCEAQLIGTPIIASNVGGISQLVKDGETGLLFPYNEPYTLAFKILDIYSNESILETLSEKERAVSHQRHDSNSISQKVSEIYKWIINNDKEFN